MKSYTKELFLYQPSKGYRYNSDTHFLYNFIKINLQKYKNIKGDILDIGSGSGILGLLLKRKYHKLNLYQIEIQDEFAFLSTKNTSINNLSSTLYQDDFLNYDFNQKFDYIVSNPPFYSSNVIKSENNSLKIARYSDSLPLKDFIQKVSKILTPKGKFFFCYDAKELDNIIKYISNTNLNIEVIQFLHPTDEKTATLVMVYAKLNSKSQLQILPPLIMFDKNQQFTQTVQNIYEECSTYSVSF